MGNIDNMPEVNNNFYEKYHPQIRAVVIKILGGSNQAQDIEDCVSTVFLELMEKLRQYNETRGSLAAFVTVIARSTALNYRKSAMRKSAELVGDELIDYISAPLEIGDKLEFQMLVNTIIEKLNKQESILFSMKYLYYYTPEEIAKAFRINRNAVDARVNRLKNKIQKFLTKGGVKL